MLYSGGLFTEIKGNFGIFGNVSLSPSYNMSLSNFGNLVVLGADAHYNFFIGDKFVAYPLLGFRVITFRSNIGTALSIGGGANLYITNRLRLYSEYKYMGGMAFSAGMLISLN